MKTAGIVAEYNPFHNGHKYHIERTKLLTGADSVAVVMSGNFVQRGETAVMSKWARAESAVENGADLVVELPTVWSIARAQSFSEGAVSLLHALGVDVISFGSESGDIDALTTAANALNDEKVLALLQKNLEKGMSFASARAEAVRSLYGEKCFEILNEPNNILGMEYILANRGEAELFTVKRFGAEHDGNSHEGEFSSASQIRKMMLENEEFSAFVPESTKRIFEREKGNGTAPVSYRELEKSILCRMRQLTAREIAQAPDVSEGIENRIHDAAKKARSLDELFALAKTKRYPHARIRRIVLASFLGIRKELCSEQPPYIKVLAMNEKGREILREAKKKASLPIITKAADAEKLNETAKKMYELESVFTDIYSLAAPEVQPCGREKTEKLIVK